MLGSSYELYYPHMMPICARDDSYGSVMRIFCMSFCLRCRAGFGCLPALSGDFWTLSPPLRVQISPENHLIVQKSPDNAANVQKPPESPAGVQKSPGNAARVRIPPESAPPSNTPPERGAPLTVPFGPLAERLWQNERRREKIRAQP